MSNINIYDTYETSNINIYGTYEMSKYKYIWHLPLAATSSTGTLLICDMYPSSEKMANPANTLVPQLINATTKASLKKIHEVIKWRT